MKKKFFLTFLVLALVTVGCDSRANAGKNQNLTNYVKEDGTFDVPLDTIQDVDLSSIKHDRLLVKTDDPSPEIKVSEKLKKLGVLSIKEIYKHSSWKMLSLSDKVKAEDVISKIRKTKEFDLVDFDYILEADGEISPEGYGEGYDSKHQPYMETMGIKDAWKYMDKNSPVDSKGNKITGAGGSKDVVVAVVDTGVDYNHPDLKDNMWVNKNEIPNNGIDDDGNGYIDDYYGWNAVGDDGNPMDDSGHGTHCAGIIASKQNKEGSTGVAYNTKIMAVKCGNDGGFTSANIAESINYAYENGADIISMSVAGTYLSLIAEEAFERANSSCLCVTAAGNDGLKNEPQYPGDPLFKPMYPACFPYVLGVMACDYTGEPAWFTNWDTFHDNEIEYEIYACGVNVYSTFPNNQYCTWNGTSMATPMVAGVAALIRSMFPDKDQYSSKFLMSQIVDNAKGEYPGVLNAYDAISKAPSPNLRLYDYYAFDSKELSPKNNEDGVIDAGETVRIGVSLRNRGGVAKDITLKAYNDSVSGHADQYFELLDDEMSLDSIGTYSIREPRFVLDDNGKKVDIEDGFIIKVADDCADNYQIVLRMEVNYKNGLDLNDKTVYRIKGGSSYNDMTDLCFYVNTGMKLPSYIGEDTVFDNSKKYILQNNLVIGEGATVTFTEGVNITVFSVDGSYYDVLTNSLQFIIDEGSTLNFIGSKDNHIVIKNNTKFEFENVVYYIKNSGTCNCIYTDFENLKSNGGREKAITLADHCTFYHNFPEFAIVNGAVVHQIDDGGNLNFKTVKNSIFTGVDLTDIFTVTADVFEGNYWDLIKGKTDYYPYPNLYNLEVYKEFNNNVIVQNREFDRNSGSNGDYDPLKITLHQVTSVNNNVFANIYDENYLPLAKTLRINVEDGSVSNWYNNEFLGLCGIFKDHVVLDYFAGFENVKVKYLETELEDNRPAYIKDIKLYDNNGQEVQSVGKEDLTVKIFFNKDLDTSSPLVVNFGSRRPFNDYNIQGEFIDTKTWVGHYKITSMIEGGKNWFNISGGKTLDGMQLLDKGYRFSFNIDLFSAESMSMQTQSLEQGIKLSWNQDDYDTLMGYNIYRSYDKNGEFVKINSRIIPNDVTEYIDEDAESGETYWYAFTIVLTDLTESSPSSKVRATALDTTNPRLYHTPISDGYANTNLMISCNASDNCESLQAILYYRTKGQSAYKKATMSQSNNKYFVSIPGSDISLEGLEYYIEVSDGVNTSYKGGVDSPFSVLIKAEVVPLMLGDVDGDGTIGTKDALMLFQAINDEILLTSEQFQRADLNKDKILSSVEALRILQFINGNVTNLDM